MRASPLSPTTPWSCQINLRGTIIMRFVHVKVIALTLGALLAVGLNAPLSAAEPVKLPTESAMALVTRKVMPAYPAAAKQFGIHGELDLEVVVGKKGEVTEAKVLSGNPMFANVCLAAAREWKFTPLVRDGVVTAFETTLAFGFHGHQ
jgi:TonB family protein